MRRSFQLSNGGRLTPGLASLRAAPSPRGEGFSELPAPSPRAPRRQADSLVTARRQAIPLRWKGCGRASFGIMHSRCVRRKRALPYTTSRRGKRSVTRNALAAVSGDLAYVRCGRYCARATRIPPSAFRCRRGSNSSPGDVSSGTRRPGRRRAAPRHRHRPRYSTARARRFNACPAGCRCSGQGASGLPG